MISVSVKNLADVRKAVNGVHRELQKNISVAINETAKKGKSGIAKDIAAELAVTQKIIRSQISASGANKDNLESKLTLKPSKRIPLRDFGARQNKNGVTYRISKTTGRRTIEGAFQGPRPGAIKTSWRGRVFKRAGNARLPIVQLYGPSPWGVFVNPKRNLTDKQVRELQAELNKQIQRRIRFLLLKSSGTLRKK